MSERAVPSDGQRGDLLAGPVFGRPVRPPPAGATVYGVRPQSWLVKGVLGTVFGFRGVRVAGEWSEAAGSERHALVVGPGAGGDSSWDACLERVGSRAAAIDVRAAERMLRAAGAPVSRACEQGSRTPAVKVFRCRMSTDVYPAAPAITIAPHAPPAAGFAPGDTVHAYSHAPDGSLRLEGLLRDEALASFLSRSGGSAWGLTAQGRVAALITVATPAGGQVTIMDLAAVDRPPEPSGSEGPAWQLFLDALGFGTAVFGRFGTACAGYDDFVGVVQALADRHPRQARLERIGSSAGGRPLWMLRVGPAGARGAVLNTCAIHPLEWAPAYGLLRYARALLESLDSGSPYARLALDAREWRWVLSACPDGWESRDQQPSGINLNRNFPGSWPRCVPGELYWDSYNSRFSPSDSEPLVARGPAPGSQPESQALMALIDGSVRTLADFHETTAPDSFLHQHEEDDGSVRDAGYHLELVDGLAAAFNGRFLGHANLLAFRPGLNDFPSYRPRLYTCVERLVPSNQSGWCEFALRGGARSLVVEAAGSDCTHYQTIRRTEFAALAAEQALFAERGRLVRNPWGAERTVTVRPSRGRTAARALIYSPDERLLRDSVLPAGDAWTCELPAGGWAVLEYGQA